MGVPGYFAWLLKKYKEKLILVREIPKKKRTLYLDTNCLIHPQCKKTIDQYKKWLNIEEIQTKMIKRIVNYITYLVNYVKPKRLFIAIDGVAPLAKIKQQRQRRYKSVKDIEIINSIKTKYKLPLEQTWNSTAITPGTNFMYELAKVLSKLKYDNVEIVFSSSNHPGEGEHKILQDLKKSKIQKEYADIIYGLDADLIFLSLASNREDIYLLREMQCFDDVPVDPKIIEEPLIYVDIDIVKKCISDYFLKSLTEGLFRDFDKKDFVEKDFINSFIFICYFMGNDFIPKFPSIDVKLDGLDLMLTAYLDCFLEFNEHIIKITETESIINKKFLIEFVSMLAGVEDFYFNITLPKHKKKILNKRCYKRTYFDIEYFQYNNMQYDVYDDIQLGQGLEEKWKDRYYTKYFLLDTENTYIERINKICDEYLKGLQWVTQYYFFECPDWRWYYPYNHAPFLSDFAKFLKNAKMNYKFTKHTPIFAFTQLCLVLPPACSFLLPKSYQYLMTSDISPIIHMYPIDFEQDEINKTMQHECIPILPPINVMLIEKITKKLKLSKKELDRLNL